MTVNDMENNSGVTGVQEYRLVDDIIINREVPLIETSSNNQPQVEYRQGENQPLQIKAGIAQGKKVSVFDVAAYVLNRVHECTTMKLHKLLYYCQAWTLVWDEEPLFKEKIEAWANGPVIRELFNFHKGMFLIKSSDMSLGNEYVLSERQKENINEVLDFYGDKSSQWLVDQTHMETPWIEARKGLDQTERGNRTIELDAMYQFYSSMR